MAEYRHEQSSLIPLLVMHIRHLFILFSESLKPDLSIPSQLCFAPNCRFSHQSRSHMNHKKWITFVWHHPHVHTHTTAASSSLWHLGNRHSSCCSCSHRVWPRTPITEDSRNQRELLLLHCHHLQDGAESCCSTPLWVMDAFAGMIHCDEVACPPTYLRELSNQPPTYPIIAAKFCATLCSEPTTAWNRVYWP